MNPKIGNVLVLVLSHGDTNGISGTGPQITFSWTLKIGASRGPVLLEKKGSI